MSKYAAILSAGSRLGTGHIATSMADRFRNVVDLSVTIVHSSAEATSAAREMASRADVVIAVGGDGTVADVATGILGTGATLGIVPAGSTNITARSLGIPANPRTAIGLLLEPESTIEIDVGISEDRCFLNMGGAGFDAELFRTANPTWKKRLGWLAYLPAAAAALRLNPSSIIVTCDAERIEVASPLVLVANGGSAVAPTFKLHPHIAADDGWLDILVFTAITPPQVAATLGQLGSQRLDRSPYVIWRRARSVKIEAEPALDVELDGDVCGVTPRDFSVRPAALRVVVPS
jgi:YegS/Rv2252/BmrU family lipid kinase